ncbi:hypothetical protein vBRpoSV10_216 [Ruegeria phage vB_RpoS-V10]|nr:hypothetical protein vBRpoSV10_216 [Ruegeria phage vB_RpoS-V10]
MGIQDDIFDVDAALIEADNGAAVDAFDRVTDYIGDLERQLAGQTRLLHDLAAGMRALETLKQMGV